MGSMEASNDPPPKQTSDANRATVAALRCIFEPLTALLKPEIESIVVYDAAAQTSISSQPEPAR